LLIACCGYTPNLVRDEWVNIGVLVFGPANRAERRMRLIEEPEEYARVRRAASAGRRGVAAGLARRPGKLVFDGFAAFQWQCC